jgi:MOSC domain-containing protein YiiM
MVSRISVAQSTGINVVSINVGQPQPIRLGDRIVLTSIFKSPVQSRVAVRQHNIEGDRQADLRVHGGPYKAVYAYASEHYPAWRNHLGLADLQWGAFGENLTLQGLTEEVAHIGDQYRIGSAVLEITQPRMPCFKLNLRFRRSDMVKRLWQTGYSGIYLSIVEEGHMGAGDEAKLISRPEEAISIASVVRLYKGQVTDEQTFEQMLRSPLRGSWKKDIRERWEQAPLSLLS